MKTVPAPVIKTHKDLRSAFKSLDRVFMAPAGTPEADEREVLAVLIESYERTHFPIDAPDPVTAIHFAMEQRGYTRKKVADILGGPSRLSEILNGRRNLSLAQIRALHAGLQIPLASLIGSAEPEPRKSKATTQAQPIHAKGR